MILLPEKCAQFAIIQTVLGRILLISLFHINLEFRFNITMYFYIFSFRIARLQYLKLDLLSADNDDTNNLFIRQLQRHITRTPPTLPQDEIRIFSKKGHRRMWCGRDAKRGALKVRINFTKSPWIRFHVVLRGRRNIYKRHSTELVGCIYGNICNQLAFHDSEHVRREAIYSKSQVCGIVCLFGGI